MSTLTLTIIQTNLFWEDKKANLEMLEKKINSIAQKTEIVILPEMFSTGFTMQVQKLGEKMDGPTVTWMRSIADSKKIILTGSLIIEEDGVYFNRLIWMLPNGEFGYYDKRHLFAYAQEEQFYHPGDKRLIASVNGWKINLLICYDLRFPVWARQQHVFNADEEITHSEYDLMIYVANWPERRIHAWKTLLPARAIENQCFVIGVNRVGQDGNGIAYAGDSMVIDPLGTTIYSKTGEEDIFTCVLQKETIESTRRQFPFWKDADHFFIES